MPGPADNRRIDAFGTYEAEAEQALANPVIVPLLGRAVLRVAGEDASSFLHAQLTADIAALRPGDSTLAAWCTPKGRVIVTAHVARTEQDFLLVLSADLADKVLARLRMFVLRAKVTIEDASSRLAVMGYSGAGADDPVLEPPPPATLAPVHLRCAPSSVGPRSMLVGNAETLAAAWDECTTAGAVAVGEAVWDLLCLLAAEPTIGAVASEAHLPQMLNLDVLAAVSFSKGCYPGQEIVARTQYLAQLTRRLMLLEAVCESPPAAAHPGTV